MNESQPQPPAQNSGEEKPRLTVNQPKTLTGDEVESVIGEWIIWSSNKYDLGWQCVIHTYEGQIEIFRETKEQCEQIAAQIVEDHNFLIGCSPANQIAEENEKLFKGVKELRQERDQLKSELAKAQSAIDFCKGAFNETLNLINLSEHPTLVQLCEDNQKMRSELSICRDDIKIDIKIITGLNAQIEKRDLEIARLRGELTNKIQ